MRSIKAECNGCARTMFRNDWYNIGHNGRMVRYCPWCFEDFTWTTDYMDRSLKHGL